MKWNFPPHYRLVPAEFITARLERAGRLCREQGLDGLLFTHAVDIFYLSGTMQQGAVFVDQRGRARLFLRRNVERGRAESPLEVEAVGGFSDIARELAPGPGSRLGLTLDVMPAREYLGWVKRLAGAELIDASGPWQDLKAVKDAWELEALARAGSIAVRAYGELPKLLKPGVSEAWVAGMVLARAMELGGMDIVRSRSPYMDNFTWHLVGGPEGAAPSAIDAPFGGMGPSPAFPQGASLMPLRPGQPIIVDLGMCYDGYITDQTRTYCLGRAPAEVRRAHECLEAVEATLMERLVPGAVSGDLFEAAVEVARRMGMEYAFLGRPEQRIKYAAHGVGLELGVAPYLLQGSDKLVRAHEVYALELKMVLDIGPVGLENTVAVNPQGPPTCLTPIPGELTEL